jgi:hypothetical protein
MIKFGHTEASMQSDAGSFHWSLLVDKTGSGMGEKGGSRSRVDADPPNADKLS